MADQIPFNQLLAQLMTENRISQSELARQTGLHRSRINEYLSGKSHPRPDKLRLLYAALNYEPDNEGPTQQMLEAAAQFDNRPSRKAANKRKRDILYKVNRLNDDNQAVVLRIIDALLYQQDNDTKEDYPL